MANIKAVLVKDGKATVVSCRLTRETHPAWYIAAILIIGILGGAGVMKAINMSALADVEANPFAGIESAQPAPPVSR